MERWMELIKGLIMLGLVITVMTILFMDRWVESDVPDHYIDEEYSDVGSERVPVGNDAETGALEDQKGETGQLIVETYTAEPTVVETYVAGMEDPRQSVSSGLRQELTMSEIELMERGKVIYLTFDDGPSKFTEELLDILADYNVKATFFVTAGNPSYLDLIGRAKEEGHTIGIHCFNHDYKKIYVSERAYFADLQMIDDIIYEQTGERAELVRFPGGSSNEVSRFNKGIMTRLTALVEEKGYRYFDWNVLSGDAGETKVTEEIIQNIIDGILKKDISVVLQHDLYDYSIAAVEEIIIWGLENGYAFLPLSADSPTIHHPIAN